MVDVVVVVILMLRKPVVVVTIWHCRELRKSVVVVVAKLWVLLLRMSTVVALLRQVVLPTLAPCQEVLQLGVAGGGGQEAAGQAGGHQVGAGARLLHKVYDNENNGGGCLLSCRSTQPVAILIKSRGTLQM